MPRKRLNEEEAATEAAPPEAAETGGSFFATPEKANTFSSGSTMLDAILGGGWGERRIANIIGDKSTGKTLLAIEACANFIRKHPEGDIIYCEAEAAFDIEYAQTLGMPVDRVTFGDTIIDGPVYTVEDWYDIVQSVCEQGAKDKHPKLMILDSLDALSDRAETTRELDQGTFGASKAKQLSQIFRRITQDLEKANVTLLVISQVRENIGVTFGSKYTRSGGKALEFYCSQIIMLAHTGQIKRTMKGVERVVGVKIKANCTKNKIGLPFRQASFPIQFGYGIDDIASMLDWLVETKRYEDVGFDSKEHVLKTAKGLAKLSDEDYDALVTDLQKQVPEIWSSIEEGFLPTRKKYG